MSVEDTLVKTNLINHNRLIIFNKIDLVNTETLEYIKVKYQQPCVSSLKNIGLQDARVQIEKIINANFKKKGVANL